MSIDRAWPRRALVSPPHFGRSLPSLWTESVVTFSRVAMADDGRGGFTRSAGPEEFLISRAHVELKGETAVDMAGTTGDTLRRKRLLVLMPMPPSEDMPKPGDTVAWTDDIGHTYTLHVDTVESPLNISDHLEVVTEAFT